MLNTIIPVPNPLNLNDQFLLDEAVSGGPFNDIIRGDNGNGIGHELTHDNLPLINGLSTLLSSTGTLLPGTGVTPAFDTAGNILLGGPGSDVLEGRGGNDLIDGDAWLNIRLTAVDRTTGQTISASGLSDLQAAAVDGNIDPGTITIVREILSTPVDASCDTAQFSDVRSNYAVTSNANGTWTVSHNGALGVPGIDGIDTVRNVERLKFADRTVAIGAPGTCGSNATGTVAVSDTTPTEKQTLTAMASITDPDGFNASGVVLNWQSETAPTTWVTVRTGTSFVPTNAEVGLRLRVVASFTDNVGVLESVTGAPTDPVANVNDVPTGAPVLSTSTPVVGTAVTVDTSSIADADGLVGVTFNLQWQAGTADISGATGPSFTPTTAQVGAALRVVARYTDNHGTAETVVSAPTAPVVVAIAPVAKVTPSSLAFGPQGTGTTSAPQTITVANTGNTNLVVSGVSLTGANQLDFSVANACGTVAPGASCQVAVSFRPSIAGAESATLSISHNATGSPSTVGLSGTGVVPAVLSVAGSLDFGPQRINTNTTKMLFVSNTGTATLVFGGISTSTPFFTVSMGSCPASLAPGKSCKISVTFRPLVIQAYTAKLTLLSNATNSPTVVNLTGSGKK
jgi:hypothetical protein